MGNADFTTTVRLADGTRATLFVTWDASAGRGNVTLHANGEITDYHGLERAAWEWRVRRLLGRREAAWPQEGE